MAINSAIIAAGPTGSFSGGTTYTLTVDGLEVKNGVHAIDASNADVRTRKSVTFKSVPASYKQNAWSNDRYEFSVTHPKILESGEQRFPNIRVQISKPPECSVAEIDNLCLDAAQVLVLAAFQAFRRTGSLA